MLGQTRLLEDIDGIMKHNAFPRFSIVVGERGMEHEDVAHYIANKMEADYIKLPDVKVDTIRDMIKKAYSLHNKTVFCIPNADEMSVNAKNAILKVIEEPPNKTYFVMCLEDLQNTLTTIRSRGAVFPMCPCSSSQIGEFARELFVDTVDEDVVKIAETVCRSPGEVCLLMKMGAKNFYSYVEWVADSIFTLSGAEVFKISDKLALKDEEDKFDVLLFVRALQTVLLKNACENDDNLACKCNVVNAISNYAKDLRIKGINKGMLLDTMYLEMRRIWKSQT